MLESDVDGILQQTSLKRESEVLFGDQYVTLSFRGSWVKGLTHVSPEALTEIISAIPTSVIINFSYVDPEVETTALSQEIAESAERLIEISRQALKAGKSVSLIRCPAKLLDAVKVYPGPTEDLPSFGSLAEALRMQGSPLLSGEAELDIMAKAVQEVFEKQFSMTVRSHSPLLLMDPKAESFGGDIIGLIPLQAEGAKGTLVVRFLLSTLLILGRKTFGEQLQIDDPELPQIGAELTNMILGCAKDELNARGFGIEQALPRTYIADPKSSKESFILLSRPSWRIDFETQAGELSLEICIHYTGSVESPSV